MIKENLKIYSVPAPTSNMDFFRYRIDIYYNSSLAVKVNEQIYLHPSNVKVTTQGRIEFLDPTTNETVFYIPEPFVVDSTLQ